ncbi:hypothetical protein StoSoilB22_38850 [Arthrobacter sp. StoSoilB22]|nr:hypothetical protein StoSoilB22_38850 [Arthrobacter sp. StoSoilB22]
MPIHWAAVLRQRSACPVSAWTSALQYPSALESVWESQFLWESGSVWECPLASAQAV